MKLTRWLSTCAFTVLVATNARAQTQGTATEQNATTPEAAVASSADGTGLVKGASDTDNGGVGEIVVTAQRREERLQDVPVAITAVSAARLEAAGVASTQQLSFITPGLTATEVAGFAQPHIRGVGSSTNGPGLEQPVATYIDGVYIASAPSSLLTLNNVERVEVLKGPQGTLFGRNATGGLIQVITKDPRQEPSVSVNITEANYRDTVADAYVTGGLTDTLAADVAVRYEHQEDGWGRNLATGNPTENLPHDFAGRVKFLWRPTDTTTARLTADYEDRTSRLEVQHADPQYPSNLNNPLFGGPYPQGGPYDINNNIEPENSLRSKGISLQVNQDLGGLVLQGITAYRDMKYDFSLDFDEIPTNVITAFGHDHDKQFSQELQISAKNPGRLKWVAGIYYFYNDAGYAPSDIVFGPTIAAPVPGLPAEILTTDSQRTNAVAGYGQATYKLFDATNLTLGGRYSYEHKRLSGSQNILINGRSVGITPIPAPDSGVPDSTSFRNFSYRVAIDHKFSQDVMGYLSYNTGFKAGGFNLGVPTNLPYKPEKIYAVEGGLKSEFFDRHLRVNVAGYHYSYTNIQVGRFTSVVETIVNGARAEVYGSDLDIEAVIFKGLSLTAGAAYNHATFSSFPNADFIVPVGGCVPAPGGICPGDASGKRLPFAPTFTYNAGVSYKVQTGIGGFATDVNYYHTSKYFSNPDNVGFQAPYELLGASVTWTSPDDHLSIRLFGRNLTKQVYTTSLSEAVQGLTDAVGAPRTYGLTAGFKF